MNALEKFIPIKTQGKWNQKDIHTSSIGMTSERMSIHSIQPVIKDCPTETPFRNHLSKLNMEYLKRINQELLTNKIIEEIFRHKPVKIAIDETDDTYYGEITSINNENVVKYKVKKSTKFFYIYITLYLILGDWKLTLSILPVKKKTTILAYIKQMLKKVENLDFSIEVLLLDRGFYGSELFRYLMQEEIPDIAPVKVHSEDMNQLLKGRKSRYAKYTMSKTTNPLELDVAICVKYLNGRYDKHENRNYGYFVYGIDWKPNKVTSVYSKRFGIESSYRMRNIVKPRTNTKNPVIMYYFALVSLLLKNIWVSLRYRSFPQIRRGPRIVDEDKFRFDQFRLMLWYAFCRLFGFERLIPIHRSKGSHVMIMMLAYENRSYKGEKW